MTEREYWEQQTEAENIVNETCSFGYGYDYEKIEPIIVEDYEVFKKKMIELFKDEIINKQLKES